MANFRFMVNSRHAAVHFVRRITEEFSLLELVTNEYEFKVSAGRGGRHCIENMIVFACRALPPQRTLTGSNCRICMFRTATKAYTFSLVLKFDRKACSLQDVLQRDN